MPVLRSLWYWLRGQRELEGQPVKVAHWPVSMTQPRYTYHTEAELRALGLRKAAELETEARRKRKFYGEAPPPDHARVMNARDAELLDERGLYRGLQDLDRYLKEEED